MIRLLAVLNTVIGTTALTLFAVVSHHDLFNPSQDGFLLLAVGGAALAAAGMGLHRIGVLLHGLGASLIVAWALDLKIGDETSASQALKALGSLAVESPLLLGLGGLLFASGAWIDYRKPRVRKAKPAPEVATAPQVKTPTTKAPVEKTKTVAGNTRPRIEPLPDHPGRKKVICSCGKKMRVKLEAKRVKCPGCSSVLDLE